MAIVGVAPFHALAQAAIATAPSGPQSPPSAQATVGEVVVTGSILHHKNTDTISPLTVVTSADLEKRGITTIEDAIQSLSINNSGALPNAFTANGAFASGRRAPRFAA